MNNIMFFDSGYGYLLEIYAMYSTNSVRIRMIGYDGLVDLSKEAYIHVNLPIIKNGHVFFIEEMKRWQL